MGTDILPVFGPEGRGYGRAAVASRFRTRGDAGLAIGPAPGRPRKPTPTRGKTVPRRPSECPWRHGLVTGLGRKRRPRRKTCRGHLPTKNGSFNFMIL